ncbi:MAG: transcriptional repressor [Fimbriimonadaceae bacterium]|nr:transcriptional repressor [Fimbriimonadaceae bacterium]QYK56258.1 MAG: transcriptional repressor [Fimbriimonadaceae bacterium]
MAIDRLKYHGFRITMPRIQVIRTLARVERPLSAYGIHEEIVTNGGRIDVVSVYRILATLVEVGLVHHIGIVDGYIACRFEEEHPSQSQHVVCRVCGKVVELPLPSLISEETDKQLADIGFTNGITRVEILADCPDCQKNA